MPPGLKKTCFVIGPMGKGHLERLEWLAREVLAPILGDAYSVFTPNVKELGNIMNHVIRSCDRADLVVADTTGNNPNVLYEIAILDAMGRPCIPVKFKLQEKEVDLMVFDLAAYRFFELEQDTASAQKELKEVIEQVRLQRDRGELFSNPITNFFQNPLNSLASARGLASGYVQNFVTPSQGVITQGPDFAVGKGKLEVQTLLPTRLAQATRNAVEKVFEQGRIKKVVVEAAGRSITAYVWAEHRDAKDNPIIVDIPTAMAALRDNVHARLGAGNPRDPKSAEFRSLEDDEIAQFVRYVEIFSNDGIGNGIIRDNYKIIKVADCFEPNLLD